ncbi:cleavage and polyadenylation specificity factor subunit 3-II-like isoform X2 [Euphorbia lathyris]|uniref:cleavage and polyadenylation specificity factor subunit 3-II-like isoform X2 n=1 Tax=Euphorbia lathyris TaxID=212925 RepID=UPI0033136A02
MITAAIPISHLSLNLLILIVPLIALSSPTCALPYFTEVCGYKGPVYMTYPTKALAPLMLEDYRKVMVDRRGEEEQFTTDNISECMKKVIAVDLKQTVLVDKDLQIRAYYAGHVLGAAMFYAKVGDSSMVYTGDYNMTPDRHLGAAQIDRLQLDLLITESTYATTTRDSKYAREREFLKVVHKCIAGGGKVLIPTFALGRAQELCILLDDYWERMNLKVPIYFSAGLTIQANMYYKMLIGWTSQKVKESYATQNAFDFKNVRDFDRSMIDAPGPCVLFATPGMISGGFSLEVFKRWAPYETNLVTLPGYCVAGTVGHKLMSGKPTKINLDKDTQIDVRCQIHQLSFSPHTDAKGIMDLVTFLTPKHVMLVHGEKPKMASLKERIQSELDIPCYVPANCETVGIPSTLYVKAHTTDTFIQSCLSPNFRFLNKNPENTSDLALENGNTTSRLQVTDDRVGDGILVMEKHKMATVIHQDELLHLLGDNRHEVQFAYCCPLQVDELYKSSSAYVVAELFTELSNYLPGRNIQNSGEHLQVESFRASTCLKDECPYRRTKSATTMYFCCSWSAADEKLAWEIISTMEKWHLTSETSKPSTPNYS